MLGLLLKKDRDSLKGEYTFRFLNILFIVLILIITAGIITLFPSYILVNSQERLLGEDRSLSEDREAFERRGELIAMFSDVDNKSFLLNRTDYSYTELINVINGSSNQGVSIRLIDFSHNEDGDLIVLVQGIASDRDNLLNFSEELEKYKYFESADFPFSNFAKGNEITFSITIDVLEFKE